MNGEVLPSYMLRIFLFFIPIALCLFEYTLFRYNAIFRESEALLLDSQIQWMLFTTIAIWCASFIGLKFTLDNMWLVGLLLISIFMYFTNYLSAFQPTQAIILLAGVTLGKGSAFFFNEKNSHRIIDNSFALPQSSEIQRDLILILILLISLTSLCHLNMAGSIYHGTRWMGLWDNPNIYGMLMGAGVVLTAGLLADGRWEIEDGENGKRKLFRVSSRCPLPIILFIAAAMMAVGLVCSYSRGAWLGTAVGLLYLAWSYGKLKWRLVLPGLFVVAVVVGFFWHSTADTDAWYFKRLDLSRPSAQHRVSAWRGALQMMRDHPLGVGWNNAVSVYDKDYSPPEGGAAAITTNDYLMIGTELGLPGLICFVAYVWLCFRRSRPHLTLTLSPPAAGSGEGIRSACLAGAVVLLVAFWFDGGLFELATTAVFWILLELGGSNSEGRMKNVETESKLEMKLP